MPLDHFGELALLLPALDQLMLFTLQHMNNRKKYCRMCFQRTTKSAMVCLLLLILRLENFIQRMQHKSNIRRRKNVCSRSHIASFSNERQKFLKSEFLCVYWISVVSAVTATLVHDAISNPTEVIKQRLQMYNSPYRTVVKCAVGVYRAEGLKAFYRSYVTQLCMNLPHQTIHFSTYEFFQNKVILYLNASAIFYTKRHTFCCHSFSHRAIFVYAKFHLRSWIKIADTIRRYMW